MLKHASDVDFNYSAERGGVRFLLGHEGMIHVAPLPLPERNAGNHKSLMQERVIQYSL